MKLHELVSTPGSHKTSKRLGRGDASGKGGSAGKGTKGQMSRKGHKHKLGFEGGQMPLARRIPKRGFNNKRFALDYIEINVSDLEKFENGAEVTPEILADAGIITLPKNNDGVKVLGNGELTKKLTVKASKFTASAKEKIEKAGGTAEEV